MPKADVENVKHLANQLARHLAQLEIKNVKILIDKAVENTSLFFFV